MLFSFLKYLFSLCFILSLTACQQAQEPAPSTAGASAINSSQAAASTESPHRLIGKWEGMLEVDQQAVEQLFKDAGREDQITTALETYKTMQMKMDFEESGEMKMSIKIGTENANEENSGSGTWELIRDEGNKSIVKSKEEGSEAQEIEISFDDPDHFQMLPKGPFRNAAVLKFSRIR